MLDLGFVYTAPHEIDMHPPTIRYDTSCKHSHSRAFSVSDS